jgi:NAD(P)-dependent dehydrogenase (short-subunit alcohol dehydrogenase family)
MNEEVCNVPVAVSSCNDRDTTPVCWERNVTQTTCNNQLWLGVMLRRAMKASGTRGAIVNVTSAAGLRGGLGPAAYSASKAGVIALTQQAACECAPSGIRVNSVAPAYVNTVRRYCCRFGGFQVVAAVHSQKKSAASWSVFGGGSFLRSAHS